MPVTLIETGLLSKVHLGRRQIVQGLMDPPVIVEVEVARKLLPGLFRIGILVQIDFFVFHGAPEAFGEDVVQGAAFAVHADLHLRLLESLDVLRTGEVAALIAIPDRRRGLR